MANCHNCERLAACHWASPEEIICSSFKAKPSTNYDRVHAMSEEEFAQWLCDVAGWLPTFEGRVHPILEWLKQEASDG